LKLICPVGSQPYNGFDGAAQELVEDLEQKFVHHVLS